MAFIVDTDAGFRAESRPSDEASPSAPVRAGLGADVLPGEPWRGPTDSAWLRRILRGAGLGPEMPRWFGEVCSPGPEGEPAAVARPTDHVAEDGLSAGA